MYGFCPAMDIQSARDYMWYFSSVMIFTRDKKGNYIKISFRETLHHLAYFLLNLVLTGLLQSILDPHPYFTLFGAPPANREEWYAPSRFLTWQLYANNAFHAGTSVRCATLFRSWLDLFR